MTVEHIAKLLHSNDFVDRGSDDGEVEPIRSADIAVQHFTDVECDVDLGEGQPFRLAPQVPRLDLFQALHRGLEAAVAATLSSTSSNDIVASIASPMNLRTWPPRVRNEAVSISKVSFSISTICAPEVTSLIRVKPLNPRTTAPSGDR